MEFNEKLRNLRKQKGITQEELAGKAGISTSFIGHIERGEKIASVETLAALSESMDMDLNYMILGICRSDDIKRIKVEIQSILERYK